MVMGADQVLSYIEIVKYGMWPGGALKPKEAVRTAAQKLETRESANRKLSALMPGLSTVLHYLYMLMPLYRYSCKSYRARERPTGGS